MLSAEWLLQQNGEERYGRQLNSKGSQKPKTDYKHTVNVSYSGSNQYTDYHDYTTNIKSDLYQAAQTHNQKRAQEISVKKIT